ncbi:MAG TPA: prenyltransferase/squalene oxidase repeat-containing protein [Planctomycetota bacterium]|nr:prenyltransferase/squalene oxidase repeat-containing protein [Planctomycetota bacterium]
MLPTHLRRSSAAVLCAVVQAPCQHELQAQIDRALAQARPALMDHLKAATRRSARIGELALLVLASIHDGVDAADPTFVAASKRLAKANANDTYDLALRLMVLEAAPTMPDRLELAQDDVRTLLRHRHKHGGFTYGATTTDWDLSNTQYAALGLRAAKALGVPIDPSVWQTMADLIGAQQASNGGFAYQRLERGFDPTGYASMTAAGIAVLAICEQALGVEPAGIEKSIKRGWQWLARNASAIGSPSERRSFYFHYGLERAAILTDTTVVGDVDWYARGARMFVDTQLPGGGWTSRADGFPGAHLGEGRGDSVPTAFAVLFLRRRFQKVSDPITPHIVGLVNIGPASKQQDLEACRAELVRRGMEAMPELLWALRSDVVQKRRAAAAALAQIAGESFGYDPACEHAVNRRAVRSAELWYLKNR